MENEMHPASDQHFIPMTSVSAGEVHSVTRDVSYFTNQIVNVVFIVDPDSGKWILVDTGMPGSALKIKKIASGLFPLSDKPEAILLTHGHFDHVGAIIPLIEEWNVPVYAHPLEFPFLTGHKDYPKPDATVDGGLLAKLAFIYPYKAINIGPVLQPLPADGTIPFLSEWRWIHTPGHSPGHVSFYRGKDKTLIAGDAFITVRQDSLYKVLIQKKEVNGPPRYLTTDWNEAFQSVKKLEQLQPEIAVTGHGTAMEGTELRSELKNLVDNFDELAVPQHGKYV
jgi:glyoxylase-like metal-dependent hydrolase (beta-lactamase superfamily II)